MSLFFLFFLSFFNCTLGSGVHVQIMQHCCIDTYMVRRFAASIPLSPISGVSPHVIPPKPPYSHCPSPSPPQQTPVYDAPLPVSMCSQCSTLTYEREHVVFDFLFLRQFAENGGFQIHPRPYKGHKLILLNGCIVFHGVYVPHFLCPVYNWWHLGWLQVFAIVNNATVNICVHVSL